MKTPRFRPHLDWKPYEAELRTAASERAWTASQIDHALARDRLCTTEVDDLESHCDWHEGLGLPKDPA